MKTRVLFSLIGIAFLLFNCSSARASNSFVWVGVNSTAWTDPNNWGNAATLSYPASSYPGQLSTSDIVVIGTINLSAYGYTPANQPVLSTSVTIAQLTFGQYYTNTLTISSGKTLTVSGSITNNASTTTTIAGAGTIAGASVITISGGTFTTGASIAGSSLTMAGGTLAMSAAVTVTGAITESGTATISGGATLTAASLSLTTSNTLTLNTPVNITGSATSSTNVSPTVSIGSGYTLAITGSVSNGASSSSGLTITGAGTAKMAGFTYGYQSSFTIGSPSISTTTVTLNASSSFNMSQNNANFTNYGTLNLSSGCTWSAAATSVAINSSGTINLTNTTLNWSGNSLNFNNLGTITAKSGTTFTFAGNPQTFNNSGNISLDASTITSSGNATPITNSGNITLANASTFTVSGGGSSPLTNSGNFTATSSAINFSSGTGNTVQNSGVFSATSTPITFSGATWTLTNTGTFSAASGSNISMPGNSSYISNTAGTFTVTSSNIGLTGQPSSVQNSGTGTFSAGGSTITLAQSAFLQQTSSNAFTVNGASTVNFGFGSYITSTGTFYGGTSNSQCIFNVTSQNSNIANSTSNGKFYLGSTSIIYLSGSSSNVTNSSPGTFTLQSDQYGSAAIGAIPSSSGGMVGTFNVERYFQGSSTYDNVKKRWLGRNYRIISSPVNIGGGNKVFGLNYIVGGTAGLTTTASSATNAFVTGASGASTSLGNSSLYLFNETYTPYNAAFTGGNFVGITDITNSSSTSSTPPGAIKTSLGSTAYTIPIGNGVLFFFRGAASNWTTRTHSPYIAPENVTLTSTGTINQQSVTIKPWFNPSSSNLGYSGIGTGTNYAVRGFNMVGNPYPCSIDWNTAFSGTGITLTNINPTIWVFNPVTNQYDTYKTTSASGGVSNGGGTDGSGNATNIIASGQGFFVQANALSPAMVITESAKLATAQPTGSSLLMGTPVQNAVQQLLRLRLSIDTLNYDDMVIGFNSTAFAAYNGQEDAEYLPGVNALEGLSSYSSDNVRLAINFLPLPKQDPLVIKLDVEAALTRLYTLKKTALDAIPQVYEIWLMDKYRKDSLDLRNNKMYAFNVDLTDTNSYGKNRFEIVIRQNPALGMHLLSFTASKASDGAQVVWKTENEQNYTNFTLERSSNGGVTYDVLGGFVSSAQGTYNFLDKNPPASVDRYRLKIEDLNGAINYSSVVTLVYGNSNSAAAAISNINVYPNPASSVINLAISKPNAISYGSNLSLLQQLSTTPGFTAAATPQSYQIKIISITGSVVASVTSSQPAWRTNIGNLLPGTYIIQVVNNSDNSVVGKGTFVKL